MWIRGDYLNPAFGFTQQILAAGERACDRLHIRECIGGSRRGRGGESATLSPDGSGVNNFAYIRFSPSDNATQWHLVISSNGFQSVVYERWGAGDPRGTAEPGRRNYGNAGTASATGPQIVPNGTYTVKVEVVGLTADTSLSIVVNTAQISGIRDGRRRPGLRRAGKRPGNGYSRVQLHRDRCQWELHALRFRSGGFHYNVYATYVSTTNRFGGHGVNWRM